MKCEFCGRPIKGEPVEKVLRGQKHIFCTEMCFRFHYWKVPKFDLNPVYKKHSISVDVPDFRELIKEQEGK